MRRLHGILPAFILAGAVACAPPSRPVRGPVAEAIRQSLESGTATFDHLEWGRLLAEGTRSGRVDYRYFRERRPALDAYLARLAGRELSSLASGELEALMINAYNALTVRSILDNPEVKSIREIPGVWNEIRHRVGGYDLTLDEIEHQILRPFFRDPRIHFAVNCASMSCAALPPWAFDGSRIDEQLEELKSSFMTDPDRVRVEGGALRLSKYFDWYGSDFVTQGWHGAAETVAAYVRDAATPEVAAFIESAGGDPPISFLEYDWSLNAAVATARE